MKRLTNERLKLLSQLFWTFLRISPVTFGGGYAMIPVIEREVSVKRKWLKEEEMDDLLSMAGSAPGGVGVNASAFVGYRIGGAVGAVIAVAGITLPTFFIVCLLSLFYSQIADLPKVEAAMKGVHAAIIALILVAAYRMARSAIFDKTTAATTGVVVLTLLLTGVNPIVVIAIGLCVGAVFVWTKQLLGMQVQTEQVSTAASDEEELMYPEYYI